MLMQLLLAFGGTLLAVAGAVLAAYIWETKLRDRVAVHRIRRSDDEHIEPLIELYQELFEDDDTNYSANEILEFLDESEWAAEGRHVHAENIILAALYRRNVVGFLFCHFYGARRKAIISYYGVDKRVSEAKHTAARNLLTHLKHVLLAADHSCDYLFFDLQDVDIATPKEEARRRKARVVVFKQSAKSLGLDAYLLQFPYIGPRVSLSHDAGDHPFTLMCVPIRAKLPSPAPRELVLEFLRFIHRDCYGDLYPATDDRYAEHHAQLRQRLEHYERTLPAAVSLA